MREEVVDVMYVALVQDQGEDHLGTDTPKDGYVNLMNGPRGYCAGDGEQSLPASSTFPGDNHRHPVPSPANQVAWVQHTHTTCLPALSVVPSQREQYAAMRVLLPSEETMLPGY